MQSSHSPTPSQPDDVDVVQQLNALPQSEARARFRKLLPLIDDLVRQGVTYGAIAETLSAAGLVLNQASIRQAICRWRKKGATARTRTTPPTSREPHATSVSAPPPAPRPAVGAITSKGDLARLRRSADSIDLNQLAEIGRQK